MAIKYKPYMYMRQEFPPIKLVVIHIAIKNLKNHSLLSKIIQDKNAFICMDILSEIIA